MKFICLVLLLFSTLQLSSQKLYIVKFQSGSILQKTKENPLLKNADFANSYRKQLMKSHDDILSSVTPHGGRTRKVYSYVDAINGFSASLNEEQVEDLRAKPDVEWVLESRTLSPLTTYTPQFLNLSLGSGSGSVLSSNSASTKPTGKNVIIGIIDSGLFPECSSFNDSGLGRTPTKFKGMCQESISGPKFKCNKKVIGARYFYSGFEQANKLTLNQTKNYVSARDINGHGSHVASIAAGSFVSQAQRLGSVLGSARGIAYESRISVYKACWLINNAVRCESSDVIQALEMGIKDGVDLFSISLGSGNDVAYYEDALSMYLLEVSAKSNIPVVTSAGNSGAGTVTNTSPWVLTVAASTVDRFFGNRVELGNEKKYMGRSSISWNYLNDNFYDLIIPKSSISVQDLEDVRTCVYGSLDPFEIGGKIVLCKKGKESLHNMSLAVYMAGGMAIIVYDQVDRIVNEENIQSNIAISYVISASAKAIVSYVQTTKNPVAKILSTNPYIGSKYSIAPSIPSFSSTGPNKASKYVLKPDITAPGVNIFGAWNGYGATNSSFELQSGTSMAAPHVSGSVALIKAVHPDWKSSWIYSAIITTGYTTNNKGKCIQDSNGYCASPNHMGGGHLNVSAALDPGLVYNLDPKDYQAFNCTASGGFYQTGAKKCIRLLQEFDFNFPYLSIPNLQGRLVTYRKLTLVSKPGVYNVSVVNPSGAEVQVWPRRLKFSTLGQTMGYSVVVVRAVSNYRTDFDVRFGFTYGTITWSDGIRSVKINVAVNIP